MKESKDDRRFQTAVDYLTDYAGVIGAVIADSEGLVIASGPPNLSDGEMYAALGPEIFGTADKMIDKIVDPGCKYIAIKTADKWLTVGITMNFYLIVLADKKTDDLLNVRVQRTLEMITTHIKERYPAELYSRKPEALKMEAMEASNV